MTTIQLNPEESDLEQWEIELLKKLKKIYRSKKPPSNCCENDNCSCEALFLWYNQDLNKESQK